MGVGVNDVSEIPDAYNQLRKDQEMRDYIWTTGRFAWCMETQMPKVYKVYEEITGKKCEVASVEAAA
jgi:hypothetical protein